MFKSASPDTVVQAPTHKEATHTAAVNIHFVINTPLRLSRVFPREYFIS
jgi:hypothetical protein